MLNGDANMIDSQPATNGIGHYGPRIRDWGVVQQTPLYRHADQTGLPTPDTPSSAGTDRPWAASNGSATNGYHHVNGDTPTATRPRKRNFSHRTRTGCMTCRFRKKKCDERKPTCTNSHPLHNRANINQVEIVSGRASFVRAIPTRIPRPAIPLQSYDNPCRFSRSKPETDHPGRLTDIIIQYRTRRPADLATTKPTARTRP